MIWYLPLEYIDKRYTKDLDIQIQREFRKQDKLFIVIEGEAITQDISTGSFLDSNGTNYYKFTQLQKVCQLFANKMVKDGDIFFVSDLWFPGLESIPYMAYFNGVKVKTMGLLHAGSFTKTDYVANMESWAKYIEQGWFAFIDKIFVGSDTIKQELIEKDRIIHFGSLYNTGLPFDPEYCYRKAKTRKWNQRENVVLFTGRLVDEKQPWIFDKLAKEFPEVGFIKTMEYSYSKEEYFRLLSESKVVFSAALQENFGYSMLEAAAYGVNIVAPNRLAYAEKYPDKYLYNSYEEAKEKIKIMLEQDNSFELMRIAVAQKENVTRIVNEIC